VSSWTGSPTIPAIHRTKNLEFVDFDGLPRACFFPKGEIFLISCTFETNLVPYFCAEGPITLNAGDYFKIFSLIKITSGRTSRYSIVTLILILNRSDITLILKLLRSLKFGSFLAQYSRTLIFMSSLSSLLEPFQTPPV
jgi:hypothetical protein